MIPSFKEIPYDRPDLENLHSQSKVLLEGLRASASAAEQIEIVRQWNAFRMQIQTLGSYVGVRFTQNVNDQWALSERAFWDANSPKITEWNLDFAKELIQSPYRSDLEQEFGALFFVRLEEDLKVFSPAIEELLKKEKQLTKEYESILASAKIEFEGQTYNLSSLEPKLLSTDRDTRKRAYQARFTFAETNADALDRIYDELVKLRHEKAITLGFENFIEYQYLAMSRSEYSPQDVARFREYIKDDIVPVVAKLRKEQASRLGVESLRFHDEMLHFRDGNPVAAGDPEWIVAQASEMYKELSPETEEFFNLMIDRDLMDLVNRPGKSVGGYCTHFPTYGVPFIFSNFNGTTHDVEVLTHEAGHAFQAFRSRIHAVPEYRFPTIEACEIHSMGMEYLTWPWMNRFFGENESKFKFYHLIRSIMFLPYACAIDEFQHMVYEKPEATPVDRKNMWKAMEQKYLPWRTYEDVPFAEAGGIWQFQKHVYQMPFYYIDYALAQVCALQIWHRSLTDFKGALDRYLEICQVGGSKSFLEIVETAELISPFTPGCLEDAVHFAQNWEEHHIPRGVQFTPSSN